MYIINLTIKKLWILCRDMGVFSQRFRNLVKCLELMDIFDIMYNYYHSIRIFCIFIDIEYNMC